MFYEKYFTDPKKSEFTSDRVFEVFAYTVKQFLQATPPKFRGEEGRGSNSEFALRRVSREERGPVGSHACCMYRMPVVVIECVLVQYSYECTRTRTRAESRTPSAIVQQTSTSTYYTSTSMDYKQQLVPGTTPTQKGRVRRSFGKSSCLIWNSCHD